MSGPSSNMLMTQAVLFWIIAYWLIVLVDGESMGTAFAIVCAAMAMTFAIGAARRAVPQPSPFDSIAGRVAWSLRPRKWMLAWTGLIALFVVFGQPMMLFNYGGGRCQYIDWWLNAHWLAAQGDGAFQGCRFLATW